MGSVRQLYLCRPGIPIVLENRLFTFLQRNESYEAKRRRMIAETSAYVSECLKHPELAPHIPVIPTGSGKFPPSMTSAFWDSILFR